MVRRAQKFRLHPAWIIQPTEGGIHISGGADLIYQIECTPHATSFFTTLPATFTRNTLPETAQDTFEQLLSAEVIVPAVDHKKSTPLKTIVVSDSSKVSKVFQDHWAAYSITVTAANPEIAVLVRTKGTFADFLKESKYKTMALPHIFIDLAYHHTVSVGPLVFPGATPCVACLEGRVKTRWGDDRPPTEATAQTTLASYAAELTALELLRFAARDTSLTFKTVSHDTVERATSVNKLLTVPQCPYCTPQRAYAAGKLLYNTTQ